MPAADRTRSHTATIAYAEAGRYLVTLGGAVFLNGPICTGGSGRFRDVGCNQFVASEDIDTASFFLENNNDEAHGGHIVERLPSGQWLEIIGTAGGPYDLGIGACHRQRHGVVLPRGFGLSIPVPRLRQLSDDGPADDVDAAGETATLTTVYGRCAQLLNP